MTRPTYVAPYRLAVTTCIRLGVVFTDAEVAGLVQEGSPVRAKAFCSELARRLVLRSDGNGGYYLGPNAEAWLKTQPRTRPGGNARRYRRQQEVRDQLAGRFFRAKREGTAALLLTSRTGNRRATLALRDRQELAEVQDDEGTLTMNEVAALLRVHRKTVHREIRRQALVAVRLGRQVRIKVADYRAYVAALPQAG